ncbi:MAG TPA: helix-turn-helix domain-containing protein [Chloroflexota bacterium]|jgi:hypothetical protein|nr:helix-turn-helix domain-containing protein [Chloroflexota bacterium]
MNSTGSTGHRPEADPALLAFIKCHVRSVATWDALCVLAREVGRWFTQNQLERELGMPPARVSAALLDLVRDGIIESTTDALGAVFRIPTGEPTTIVIERLFNAARIDQNLRRIVVAHMAHGQPAPVAQH